MIHYQMTDAEVLDSFKQHVELIRAGVWDIAQEELDIVAERFEKALATVYEAEQILGSSSED